MQSSTINKEQHQDDVVARSISNVKETISNLVFSDRTSTNLEFSLDLPDESCNHTQHSKDLEHDEQQQTFNQNLTEVVNDKNENITSTQEQQTQIRKKPIFGNYPWYSSQYKVAATESEHLCCTHESSIDDHQQREEEVEPKVSDQELQVIGDDYPWYSNYYSIVDAEAKIVQIQQQLNMTFDQSPLPQEHKLQEEDEDGFYVVQRRKRIPSSTTHEKTVSSTTVRTQLTLSPDIDLEPVILHGHPSASTIIPLSVPQTTSPSSKNKPNKKKKKDKIEMILFDAPEPILSDMNKQDKHPANDEMIDSSAIDLPLQSFVINEIKTNISDSLPAPPSKEILNQHNSSISSTVELEFRYSLLCDRLDALIQPLADVPTSSKRQEEKEDHYMYDHVNRLNNMANENQTKDASNTDEQSVGLKHEKMNDREEISDATSQLQSAAAKGTPLLNIIQFSDETNIGSNINSSQQEETSIHGKISSFKESLQHLIENIQINTGIRYEDVTKISTHQQIVEQANVKNDSPCAMDNAIPTVIDETFDIASNVQLPNTNEEIKICSDADISDDKVLASNMTDNEVLVSGSSEELSTKVDEDKQQQSSSIDVFKNINNLLPSKSQTTNILESSLDFLDESFNHTQQSNDFYDHESQQTFNQSVKEVADNTNGYITLTQEQQIQIRKQPIFGNYPWYSSQYKIAATESERLFSTDPSSSDDHKQEDEVEPKLSDQELQVISDDYPWYSNYYNIVDAEAKIAQLQQQLNITIDQSPLPQKHELQEEDEDGFHVVQRRKRIPSSTTHEKTGSSTIVRTQLTLSPDIDLEPIILHGQLGASTIIPSNVTQTSSIISKKKHKKKKKDKKEMILFDAPEPTLSDINTLEIGIVQTEKLGEKHEVNNEMTTSSVIHQAMQSIVSDEKEIFNQHTSNITSTVELESQSTNQSKASNTEEEEYEHHTSDHANILDDVANENHTVNTIDATDQSTQFTHEELNHRTSVLLDQTNIESNIESNQQEETSIHNKISSFKESLQHLIENIRLNLGTNEEADAINTPAHEQIIEQTNEQNDSSSVMDYTTPVVTDMASDIMNNLPLTTTHKGMSFPSDAVVINHKDVQSQLPSNVIDHQVLVPGPSEVLSTKLEDDQQQQPLSTGLSQIMHNLLPSIEKAQPEEGMVEKLVDENESSNFITKLKSVLNGVLPNVQNVSSVSNLFLLLIIFIVYSAIVAIISDK